MLAPIRRGGDIKWRNVGLSVARDGGSYIGFRVRLSAARDGGSYIGIPQQHHFIAVAATHRREYRAGAANFHSCNAFLFGNGPFERQNDDLLTQASDKERRPVGMITNLNRNNVAWPERFQLMRKKLRALLDSGKSARNFATRV